MAEQDKAPAAATVPFSQPPAMNYSNAGFERVSERVERSRDDPQVGMAQLSDLKGPPVKKPAQMMAASALTSLKPGTTGQEEYLPEDDPDCDFQIPLRFTKSGRRRATPFPMKVREHWKRVGHIIIVEGSDTVFLSLFLAYESALHEAIQRHYLLDSRWLVLCHSAPQSLCQRDFAHVLQRGKVLLLHPQVASLGISASSPWSGHRFVLSQELPEGPLGPSRPHDVLQTEGSFRQSRWQVPQVAWWCGCWWSAVHDASGRLACRSSGHSSSTASGGDDGYSDAHGRSLGGKVERGH